MHTRLDRMVVSMIVSGRNHCRGYNYFLLSKYRFIQMKSRSRSENESGSRSSVLATIKKFVFSLRVNLVLLLE
jgi:hypothetical protein